MYLEKLPIIPYIAVLVIATIIAILCLIKCITIGRKAIDAVLMCILIILMGILAIIGRFDILDSDLEFIIGVILLLLLFGEVTRILIKAKQLKQLLDNVVFKTSYKK